WAVRRVAVHSSRGLMEAQHTWNVEAYEDVTVPAGTFKGFRVQQLVTVSSNQWGAVGSATSLPTWTFTTWYAAGAEHFVKGQSNVSGMAFELVGTERPAI